MKVKVKPNNTSKLQNKNHTTKKGQPLLTFYHLCHQEAISTRKDSGEKACDQIKKLKVYKKNLVIFMLGIWSIFMEVRHYHLNWLDEQHSSYGFEFVLSFTNVWPYDSAYNDYW